MTDLPYSTPLELSTGGVIKEVCEHFKVDEIPLYEPSGTGQHIYLLIKKINLNTADIERSLCKLFDISDKDIGYAGLKDKKAITTQWFSLSLGATANIHEVQEKIENNIEGIKVLQASKHLNKLKTGHLIGNRFTITVSGVNNTALENAVKLVEIISKHGLPNFYGPQRFGAKGDNAIHGKELITGKKKVKKHWLKKIFLSAYQSELFNKWLTYRIADGLFNELIPGDLLQNLDGGRTFPLDEERNHREEFKQNLITYTGPIFGTKVTGPTLLAKEREDKVFSTEEISEDDLKSVKLQGTRRSAKVFPVDMKVEQGQEGIILSFSMPAGSYATVVLREFTKNLS